MNCNYVTENDVCESYMNNQLDVPERVCFEHHCLGCPECFGKLAMVTSLIRLMAERSEVHADV